MVAAGRSSHPASRELVGLLVLKGYRFESDNGDGRITVVNPRTQKRVTLVADMDNPDRIKWASVDNVATTVRGAVAALRAAVADRSPALIANPLTIRQRDVLAALAGGLSVAQIARLMGVNARSVDVHVDRILRKTDTPTPNAAVHLARDNGWI